MDQSALLLFIICSIKLINLAAGLLLSCLLKMLPSFHARLRSDTGSLRLGQDKFGDDDDAGSAVGPAAAPLVPSRPVYEGPLPTPPQKAFQPGSTPAHLTHRFMVRLTDWS